MTNWHGFKLILGVLIDFSCQKAYKMIPHMLILTKNTNFSIFARCAEPKKWAWSKMGVVIDWKNVIRGKCFLNGPNKWNQVILQFRHANPTTPYVWTLRPLLNIVIQYCLDYSRFGYSRSSVIRGFWAQNFSSQTQNAPRKFMKNPVVFVNFILITRHIMLL